MRFKKGSKIEVLCKKDFPSGAWRSAEIISGNGHNYSVRYDHRDEIERVSRKAIRPCPPLDLVEDLAPGDVVEVFENFSWKMANISKVLRENYFLVRLLGSSLEFRVSKVDIRVRRSWQNDKWVVIGKIQDSGSCQERRYDENLDVDHDAKLGSLTRRKRLRISLNIRTGQIHLKDEDTVHKSHASLIRIPKRKSDSQVDPYAGGAQNFRADEKRARLDWLTSADRSELPKKADTFTLPRKTAYEKFMHPLSDRTTGYFELDSEKRKESGIVQFLTAENQESKDAESVGSCSINENHFHDFAQQRSSGSIGYMDGYSSDAESSTEDDVEAEIHRLELKAYRSTVVAFHALGPLSWEKEALISNLRRCLNISDDEHLIVIRNLVSSGNKISVR